MPVVSIIMPSLNVVDYVGECIESVMNQTLRNIEIICVDAGSTDGTIDVLKQAARRDDRIKILNCDVKSYGYQVNKGLDIATGTYVAILETDDWIEHNMYETLYKVALDNDLDYAVADFDFVYELSNNYYCHQRYRQFPKGQDMYGRVLESKEINKLRASDYLLWKGIYNRKFLLDNKIMLHESPKAAFQDMGFLQQVKTYASRAMYIDESFYRYRIGRKTASSCNLEGLRFYMNEFSWINNKLRLPFKMSNEHKKYYYYTMSISFISKYNQILKELKWDFKDARLSEPWEWFEEQLKRKLEEKVIDESLYEKEMWRELQLLIHDRQKHMLYMRKRDDVYNENINKCKKQIDDRKIIIFGCGNIGSKTLIMCNSHDMPVEAFSDNNKKLQTTGYCGYRVLSISELKNIKDALNYIILLAVKNGAKDIEKQIIDNDIDIDVIDMNMFP